MKKSRVLQSINVERQAYHGNVFVGNHCKLILKNFKLLCNVLDGYPKQYDKFMQIFTIFSRPRDLLFAKRFLTDYEIDKVVKSCEEFCDIYTVNFDKNIKP